MLVSRITFLTNYSILIKYFIKAIDSVNPQNGSTVGGDITITGQYFYSDSTVPARIEVGGQPCQLVNFDMTNLTNTKFVCKNVPQPSILNEYYGNRGVTLYRDNIYSANLASAQPSSNAQISKLNQASYTDSLGLDVTIWLKGFLNPKKSSSYEFSIETTGQAILSISQDAKSANKAQVATNSAKGTIYLEANKKL